MEQHPQPVIYRNAKVFTAAKTAWADSLVVQGNRLAWVGNEATARRMAGPGASDIDLDGKLVLPGFIDAHTHLMLMGHAVQKVELIDAANLAEIQTRLRDALANTPSADRILGKGWLFSAVPGGTPTRQMLDEAVPDVPVYLDANDYHSAWLNSAALAELGIDADTPNPVGGTVVRDQHGEATGMMLEAASLQLVLPGLAALTSDAERDAALENAFAAYAEAGVTGAIDMLMDQALVDSLLRVQAQRGGQLPLRVVGHWWVQPTGSADENLAQVARAAALAAEISGEWFRMTGIKLVLDGVIDACTAAMVSPFSDGSRPEAIWEPDALTPVVIAADAAGLQIAMHAIGDRASDIALTALEAAYRENGPRPRRHRIEHLETVLPNNVERLARLGVVASMQPVHADPAVQENWRAMLGDARVDRGFPWPEITQAGGTLAFGTDAPTAPHEALPNMFVATTRRSAISPGQLPNVPSLAVSLADALGSATRDAAYSCGDEAHRGTLATGMLADFIVLDTNPFEEGVESLLTANVVRTVVGGEVVFER